MRAHLLHYTSLLRDFSKSIEFVLNTANPAMDSNNITDAMREADKKLLEKECGNLLSEVKRLELQRGTLDERVQNVQRLVSPDIWIFLDVLQTEIQVFTSVNIEDSKAMKRLSYMSMIFLPASFVAVGQHHLKR